MDDASPVVIVELPAEAQVSPNVKTLLKACTVALRRGACILSSPDGESNPSANAVAVVTFEPEDRLQVLIEVGAQRERRPEWTSRRIVFRPEDSEGEKWRSMGFTIASLAGALGVLERPEPAQAEPKPVAPPPPAPPPKRTEIPHEVVRRPKGATSAPFHLGARFEIGPGLDDGSGRLGGALFGGYDLPGGVLSASALVADAARTSAVSDVDLTWTRFGVGLSAAAKLPLRVEGRGGVLVALERIAATETDAASGSVQTRNRWLSGIELDVSARWPRASPVGGVIGAYLLRLSGGTAVVSHGVALASSPATESGVFLGIEVRL